MSLEHCHSCTVVAPHSGPEPPKPPSGHTPPTNNSCVQPPVARLILPEPPKNWPPMFPEWTQVAVPAPPVRVPVWDIDVGLPSMFPSKFKIHPPAVTTLSNSPRIAEKKVEGTKGTLSHSSSPLVRRQRLFVDHLCRERLGFLEQFLTKEKRSTRAM
jgi:hypothetical protein